MSHIEHRVDQGSPEWHHARAGAITASKVSLVRDKYKIGPNKGDWKAAALDYAFKLAIERESGVPLEDDEFAPWQAERGIRLEPEARKAHEVETGLIVRPVGFVTTEDGKFGASADGMVGTAAEDPGCEYKCFLAPKKLRAILLDHDVSEVRDQCQFGMAITGRRLWHLGLYCPALECVGRAFTLEVIERDEAYIDAMWVDLVAFDRIVEGYRVQLRSTDVPPWCEPMHTALKASIVSMGQA